VKGRVFTVTDQEKPHIHEIVVVEGLHDKQAVDRAVIADVWIAGGDRIARTFLHELSRAARVRGVIVLTDPDGPGERIRRRLADAIPEAHHAFVAKQLALSDGGIGVEHAAPDVIARALLAARGPATGPVLPTFDMADLAIHGLVGDAFAARLRGLVGERLGIGYANGKSFLRKLNALCVTRVEWDEAIQDVLRKERALS